MGIDEEGETSGGGGGGGGGGEGEDQMDAESRAQHAEVVSAYHGKIKAILDEASRLQLQVCVAVCCSVLRCVAVCCRVI